MNKINVQLIYVLLQLSYSHLLSLVGAPIET